VTAVRRRNGYAVTGVVLGLPIWPLGLLFSIIGLVKSRARAGSGKVLSIIGIVLSLIVAVPTVSFAVGFFETMANYGCVAPSAWTQC
jgi:hypothetical protein